MFKFINSFRKGTKAKATAHLKAQQKARKSNY